MLGPTGKYPHGKVSEDDKGELTVAVSVDQKAQIVRIDFGYDIDWLGLDKQTAISFGKALIARAMELE